MSQLESTTELILSSLSAILGRPLELCDAAVVPSGGFAVRIPELPLAVVSSDHQTFREAERILISELLGLVRAASGGESRYEILERRMLSLQRENLDLIAKNRALSEVTARDTLTGLFNRGYVLEKIDSEMNRAVRHGSPMSFLMLDIDHFKQVNDTYGHPAGDEVLRSVGKLLRESCRIYDIPGRYGGEEFCILLPETKPVNTTAVAERIRNRLAKTTLNVGEANINVTASIGVAGLESPQEGLVSPTSLIDRADRALYAAKSRGRNRVEYWRTDAA
jgi:diguanylate cyclase (GGDEF)-like protein